MCGFTTIFAYGENAPLIDKKELKTLISEEGIELYK